MNNDKQNNDINTDKQKSYIFLSDKDGKAVALNDYYKTVEKFEGAHRVTGSATSNEIVTDIRVRPGFDRNTYEFFRPNEYTPKQFKQIVGSCRAVYKSTGIVRTTVDSMTDFVTEGLRLTSPNDPVDAFFKVWGKKVDLKEKANEFVRHFFVDSNVAVKRVTAKLSKPLESQWNKISANPDIKAPVDKDNLSDREIPLKYIFLDIRNLDWQDENLSKLVGDKQLVFTLPKNIIGTIQNPKTANQKKLVELLPKDIYDQIKNGKVLLDMDKVYVCFNKKDDWESWAHPYLGAVLKDLYFKEKLRQAEISAIDGIINVIRLWKLGDHVNGFFPEAPIVDKLINILEGNYGGGALDIVWDSMIDMKEFYPPVDKILGSEKYTQVNSDILIALGIPEVLIGGKGGNFSNAFIQLKTLVEKLDYARTKLTEWLSLEVNNVCKAMGIKDVPVIKFNQMNLYDENVTRRLVLNLLDRGIISVEAVLDLYGEDFALEIERIKREKPLLEKADIEVRTPLLTDEQKDPLPTAGGPATPGRPTDTKETQRKTRTPKVRTSGNSGIDTTIFAIDIVDKIDKYLIGKYLEINSLKNARQLTDEHRNEINDIRLFMLSSLKPEDDISDLDVLITNSQDLNLFAKINNGISEFINKTGKSPTLEESKNIEAISWANYYLI